MGSPILVIGDQTQSPTGGGSGATTVLPGHDQLWTGSLEKVKATAHSAREIWQLGFSPLALFRIDGN